MNDVFLSKKNTGLMRVIVLTLVVILIFYLVDTSLINSYVAAENGWDVLIFIKNLLIGGAIFEGGKWLLTSGAIASLTSGGAIAVLAGLGAFGHLVYSAHMNSGGSRVLNYQNTDGCFTTDGVIWHCRYGGNDSGQVVEEFYLRGI